MDILYILLTIFAFRALELLFKRRIANTLGINLSSASYDSGAESAAHMVTLRDDGSNTVENGNGNGIPIRSVSTITAQGRMVVDQTSGNLGRLEIGQSYGGIRRLYINSPGSGNGQVFNLGSAPRRQSWFILVSFKRQGSDRIDTELHLVNNSGAAGSHLDSVIHNNDNSAGLDDASFAFDGNDMILTVDLGQDGDQLTVTALG